MQDKEIEIIKGSGNVFRDLGFKNPEKEMLKTKIATCIEEEINRLGLSQTNAAALLGIAQSKLSLIVRGRLKAFSVYFLLNLMSKLGYEITIKLEKENREVIELQMEKEQ